MGSSKFASAIKHPVWISVATVVGVLALIATYLQAGGDSKPADLEIAAVAFGDPTAIEAKSGMSYTDAVGEEWEQITEAATPVDITLKNNGGTPAHIVGVETKVLTARSIDCSMQGGGAVVSAFYGVALPLDPWQISELSLPEAVSTPVDFTVKKGSVDRMNVTVGPEQVGNGNPMVIAAQLRLIPERGEAIDVPPLALSQPDLVEQTVTNGVKFWSNEKCIHEVAQFLDRIFASTEIQSPDVVRLRDAVQALG